MKFYNAIWTDPYNERGTKSLVFGVQDGKVVKTEPFMPWANGRAIDLVQNYFKSAGSPFHEVVK